MSALPSLTPDQARLIDQICDRFEAAWRAGSRPRPEDYLNGVEEPLQPALLRQLLLLDWEYRLHAGETPQAAEYQARFPAYPAAVEGLSRAARQLTGTAPVRRSAVPASHDTAPDALPLSEGAGDGARAAPSAASTRYCIRRFLAKGGLGEVHVAEDQELRREVALKQIHAEYSGHAESRQRFLLEAQVTGGLEHPGIVPVYGLGTGADGRPYYAMRLIRGESLREAIHQLHAGQGGYSLRGLLLRFLVVCNAVAYAHSRGVLHRDLKPSNIMLGPFGETLVVDWGLARVRRQESGVSDSNSAPARSASEGQTTVPSVGDGLLVPGLAATRTGQVVGTPAYMSPEQAAGRLDELGPASDVWSLGTVLYELLTGRPPFTGEAHAVLRQVERGEFPPPRQANPAVPQALEAVCLKAMALRPADRYPSALDLAADVERWLADEPVTVCRDPMIVKVVRWGRRHKTVATGLAVLLLTTLVGLAVGLWAVNRERAQTAAERDAKEQALAKETAARQQTREALNTLTDDVVGRLMARQEQLTKEDRAFLRKVLAFHEEFARRQGDTAEAGQSVADGHWRVGNIHYKLGQLREAEEAYRTALALYQQLAADFPSVPAYRQQLAIGHNDLGNLLRRMDRPQEAEAEYRAALPLRQQLAADFPTVPAHRQELAQSHNNLGVVLRDMRRAQAAEAEHRAARTLYEQLVADFPTNPAYCQNLARSYNNLGVLLSEIGRPQEAEAEHHAARTLYEQLATSFPTTPAYRQELAASHNNLGVLLRKSQPQEAEVEFRAALALQKQLAAEFPTIPTYRQELASSHHNLGALLHQSQPQEAEAEYRTALALKKQLAADFPTDPVYRQELAQSHHNLGELLSEIGRPRAAEAEYRAARTLYEQLAATFPTTSAYRQKLAASHNNLGAVLFNTGRPREAEAEYRAALALYKQLAADFPTDPDHRHWLAGSHNNLGILLDTSGRSQEAEAEYRAALALKKQLAADFPTDPAYRHSLAASHNDLGVLLRITGRLQAAEAEYRAALALYKQLVADFPTNPAYRQDLARSYNNLGVLLRITGQLQAAEAEYRTALALREQLAADFPQLPDYAHELSATLGNLARLHCDQKDFAQARVLLEDARPYHQKALKANSRDPIYQQFFRNNLRNMCEALLGLEEHAAARQEADELARFGYDPKNDTYAAARFVARCVPLAEKDVQLSEVQRQEQAQACADRAMQLLHEAVKQGFKDLADLEKNTDLDPLRSREDFQQLLQAISNAS